MACRVFQVDGYPGLRAGVFGPGGGSLGMTRASDLVARSGNDPPATLRFGMDWAPSGQGDPTMMLASNPRASAPTVASDGREAYPMPKAYAPDGHGGVQLRPDFAAAHPRVPFDFGGMAKEIDWGGFMKELGGLANSEIHDWLEDRPGLPA